MTCDHCGLPLEGRMWVRENGERNCDACHSDSQREDPFDRLDHGTPYTVPEELSPMPEITTPLYSLEPGTVLADGRTVEHAWINERNEWLTGHILDTEGRRTEHEYDAKIPVRA